MERLSKEANGARGSLFSYHESQENLSRSVIKWCAGLVAGLMLMVIGAAWTLSNQFAALEQKVTDGQIQTSERNAEVRREIQDIKVDVQRIAEQRNHG